MWKCAGIVLSGGLQRSWLDIGPSEERQVSYIAAFSATLFACYWKFKTLRYCYPLEQSTCPVIR